MSLRSSVKARHSAYLLLAAFFWGTTFVAQSIAMQTDIGPFTYNMCRFFLGGIVLLPLAIVNGHHDPYAINFKGESEIELRPSFVERKRNFIIGGAVVGLCIFAAGALQQIGLMYTTAGKSGFVTALYIVIVPIFALLLLRKKCSPLVWIAIAIAVVGFFFLCVTENFSINQGDLITLGGSFIYALHILSVDYFGQRTNGIQLSCSQLFVAGALSAICAFVLETPTVSIIVENASTIAYAGILSSGVAFTLQIVGQRDLHPATASLLMSLESVISVLAGWIILGDVLSSREILGCLLVFTGVVLAQIPWPPEKKIRFEQAKVEHSKI